MKLLLDTHIFLWFISRDIRLSTEWSDSVRDPPILIMGRESTKEMALRQAEIYELFRESDEVGGGFGWYPGHENTGITGYLG